MGIVYTPQPIVDFMCASVAEVLEKEFGKTLGSPDVNILDPCTGTGNFIVNLMKRIPKRDLPRVYAKQMFANEIMLLPYYIAAMNIEHAYYELTGEYESFEGLCFVDTLDLAESHTPQFSFMTAKNTERVERQKRTPITVIIGNPPYNAHQERENDQNKNRQYAEIDGRIAVTYARDSTANNKQALSDAYVKFFRWATDRLDDRDGVICFVSNNFFINGIAADGFRKHLASDFTSIYHFDLKGNARTSGEQRRREAGNVFNNQIRTGVGITVLVRNRNSGDRKIELHAVRDYLSATEKQRYVEAAGSFSSLEWTRIVPTAKSVWLVLNESETFEGMVPLGTKSGVNEPSVFELCSQGVKTNRDQIVYDFQLDHLRSRVELFVEKYNAEVDRYRRLVKKPEVDEFVKYDGIVWSRDLKTTSGGNGMPQ